MSGHHEEKNPRKKNDLETATREPLVKPVDFLEEAGYRMVTGPLTLAQGDLN